MKYYDGEGCSGLLIAEKYVRTMSGVARVVTPEAGAEIDYQSAVVLKAAVTPNCRHADVLIIDLTGVAYMDSSGIGCLVYAFKRYPDALRLVLPDVNVRWMEVLGWTGLKKVIPWYHSEQEALAGEVREAA